MSDFRDELFDDDDDFGLDDDDGSFDFDAGSGQSSRRVGQVIGEEDDFADTGGSGDGRILGMNAGERAFISVMLFLNVVVLGFGLLMATGRMTL
jgi:hypothetical protein